MEIKRITVRAGRVVPHPLHEYGNLKADLEMVAELDSSDDPDEVRKTLQAEIESNVEQHVSDLKEGIRDLQAVSRSRERIRRLESELESKNQELEELKADFDDRPLLSASRSS